MIQTSKLTLIYFFDKYYSIVNISECLLLITLYYALIAYITLVWKKCQFYLIRRTIQLQQWREVQKIHIISPLFLLKFFVIQLTQNCRPQCGEHIDTVFGMLSWYCYSKFSCHSIWPFYRFFCHTYIKKQTKYSSWFFYYT